MNHSITAVIPFCSIEKRFLTRCIDNLLSAGVKVEVVFFDHLYNGEPETFKDTLWYIESYIDNEDFNCIPLSWVPGKSPLHWEAYARIMGLCKSQTDYTLFIDADEIVEPISFRNWLDTGAYKKYKSLKLAQHLYSIHLTYQLKKVAYNTILCKTSWAKSLPFQVEARFNAYWNNKNRISRWLGKLGLNPDFGYYRGKPFIHHYTNVRSEAEMIKKVTNWSHSTDRNDWPDKVFDMMYNRSNKSKIGGDPYRIVPNYFNIDEENLYKIP